MLDVLICCVPACLLRYFSGRLFKPLPTFAVLAVLWLLGAVALSERGLLKATPGRASSQAATLLNAFTVLSFFILTKRTKSNGVRAALKGSRAPAPTPPLQAAAPHSSDSQTRTPSVAAPLPRSPDSPTAQPEAPSSINESPPTLTSSRVNLNRLRKFILVAGALLVATWLFPPWQRSGKLVGFEFAFSSETAAQLDVYRLVLLDLSIVVVVAMLALWPRKPRESAPAKRRPRYWTPSKVVVGILGGVLLAASVVVAMVGLAMAIRGGS